MECSTRQPVQARTGHRLAQPIRVGAESLLMRHDPKECRLTGLFRPPRLAGSGKTRTASCPAQHGRADRRRCAPRARRGPITECEAKRSASGSRASMRGVSMASSGAAPRHRTTSFGCAVGPVAGPGALGVAAPGLSPRGRLMSCGVRPRDGCPGRRVPAGRAIAASRVSSGEGPRRRARCCASRCPVPARVGRGGAPPRSGPFVP